MFTTRLIIQSTCTDLLFLSGMQMMLLDGLMFFQIDRGRMSFLMNLGPDLLSRIFANLLVVHLKNTIFAYTMYFRCTMTKTVSGSPCLLTLLHVRCQIRMLFLGCFGVCVVGAYSGRAINGNGSLEWRFTDTRAVGRDRIRTALFVISDSGIPTNLFTSFFALFNWNLDF